LYKRIDLLFTDRGPLFDIVLHDRFSKEQNVELWSNDVIDRLLSRLDGGEIPANRPPMCDSRGRIGGRAFARKTNNLAGNR